MDFSKLSSILDQMLEAGIPGYDCAVFYRHEPVFRRFAGYSDREEKKPMTGDLLYYIYSASKVITATAALQLVEQKKIQLNDRLDIYFPEFSNMQVSTPDGLVPASAPITIRDLFCMTGGLGYDLQAPSILDVRKKTAGKCPTQDVIRALAQEPLLFHPGTRFNYSLCHDVLGALIEVVSGMTFGQYLEQNIFRPCGMKDTTFRRTSEQNDRFCAQYIYRPDLQSIVRMDNTENPYVLGSEYESGGAGLITSVDDYCKFQEALISGTLLHPDTLHLMQQPQLTEEELEGYQYSQNGLFSYGLGVSVVAPGKSIPVQFGWGGRAGALTLLDTENQVTMYYAQHVLDSSQTYAEVLRGSLKQAVYEGLGIPWLADQPLLCEGN